MKKKLILFNICCLLLGTLANAQQNEAPKAKEWDVSLYGWVRTEYNFDSRQSAYAREYHLNLYPLDVAKDAAGNDKNAAGASNFLAITTRLGVNFKGPNVWGAKATGKIEGDFWGNTELTKTVAGTGTLGLLRLRHAFATLDWGKTVLTFGQTWYPTFIPEVFPGVANFNTGLMFNPFGWAGQVRIERKLTPELTFTAVAYKDREFPTATAAGGSLNSATFNSLMPIIHGQLQYKKKNILAGITAEYQSLKPTIESNKLVSTQTINSSTYMAYFKYSNKYFSAKLYGITGGNLFHLVLIGGFAGYKEANGQESYKPIKTSAFWVDLASNNAKIAPGLFFGYTKNGGTDSGFQSFYFRGADPVIPTRIVDNVWRVSTRVDFMQNKFKITPEIEYTGAKWGDRQADGTAGGNNINNVGNLRAIVRVMYSF